MDQCFRCTLEKPGALRNTGAFSNCILLSNIISLQVLLHLWVCTVTATLSLKGYEIPWNCTENFHGSISPGQTNRNKTNPTLFFLLSVTTESPLRGHSICPRALCTAGVQPSRAEFIVCRSGRGEKETVPAPVERRVTPGPGDTSGVSEGSAGNCSAFISVTGPGVIHKPNLGRAELVQRHLHEK